MSNKAQLQTNNTDLSSLIEILRGKATGGGGSIAPILQEKTVSPTTSSQSVTADAGYDGLSKVTVNAIPTVTQATPSITISNNGLITASATQTAGYVVAGTKSGTKQLSTQAAKTITPSSSSQTAVAASTYTTGAVTVSAVPTETLTATENKTYTPSTGKFFSSVTVNVANSGDSGNSASILTATSTPSQNSLTISFEIEGEPTAFSIQSAENITLATTRYVSSVNYDGTSIDGICGYKPVYGNSYTYYITDYDWSYSNKTLTITSDSASTGGYFMNGVTYELFYVTNAEVISGGSGGTTEQATPVISVNTNTGLITATAGDKSATQQLTTKAAATITPSSMSQTAVAKNVYTTGAVTVAAVPTETLTATENKTYTPTSGKYYRSVTVNVPSSGGSGGGTALTSEATPTSNSLSISFTGLQGEPTTFTVQTGANITLATTRYVTSVTNNGTNTTGVCGYKATSGSTAYYTSNYSYTYSNGTLTITSSAASTGGYFKSGTKYQLSYVTGATVSSGTTPKLQTKTATPSSSSQTIKPDSGYDGLSQVTVNAVPTETKNITTNGTYTPSAGKFFSSVTVNVSNTSSPKLQTKTVTPSSTSQTVKPDSGYNGLSQVTVNAIPSTYVQPSATQAAKTWTPTTSNQTIAAKTYCSGAQTIKGDANLKAENIKSGTSIFGVTGSYVGGYNVGDYEVLEHSTYGKILFRVAGVDIDGPGLVTLISEDIIFTCSYNDSYNGDDEYYHWSESSLRKTLNDTVYNGFISKYKSRIVAVNKVTNLHRSNAVSTAMETTSDYCWVPSVVEVGASDKYANSSYYTGGTQYPLFGSIDYYAESDKRKKKYNGSEYEWHLRNPDPYEANYNTNSHYVEKEGSITYDKQHVNRGVVICLCIQNTRIQH